MILVINEYSKQYGQFWSHLGGEVTNDPEILFRDPGSVKLVCFTGGEDVSPDLYGHRNLASYCGKARDEREVLIFEQARRCKVPMTGICRGSQFLNVMCGGTMVQHMKKSHGGGLHGCITRDGEDFQVTSTHHQMSVLGKGGEFLGRSEESLDLIDCDYDGDLRQQSGVSWSSGRRQELYVTEAFHYPKFRVFAVQHHPEFQNIEEEAPQWTLNKIAELCWGQKTRQRGLNELTEVMGA
jgi:GMP synthase-like glutamine amidotransferase